MNSSDEMDGLGYPRHFKVICIIALDFVLILHPLPAISQNPVACTRATADIFAESPTLMMNSLPYFRCPGDRQETRFDNRISRADRYMMDAEC